MHVHCRYNSSTNIFKSPIPENEMLTSECPLSIKIYFGDAFLKSKMLFNGSL